MSMDRRKRNRLSGTALLAKVAAGTATARDAELAPLDLHRTKVSAEIATRIVRVWQDNLDNETGRSLPLSVLAERFSVKSDAVKRVLNAAGIVPKKQLPDDDRTFSAHGHRRTRRLSGAW